MVQKTLRHLLLLFAVLIYYSCSNSDNFITTDIVNSGQNKIHNYTIGSLSQDSIQFIEVNFSLDNTKSYSAQNFAYIGYNLLYQDAYEKITDLTIQSTINEGFYLQINNGRKHQLKHPKGAQHRSGNITTKIVKPCHSDFNEIAKVEYSLPESEHPDLRYIKIIGVRNFTGVENLEFNLEYFVSHKDNLFNFYRNSFTCDYDWKVKYVEGSN